MGFPPFFIFIKFIGFLVLIQLFENKMVEYLSTANRRISNIEPQNIEVWFRFAQSFYKIDSIHSFDIRYS